MLPKEKVEEIFAKFCAAYPAHGSGMVAVMFSQHFEKAAQEIEQVAIERCAKFMDKRAEELGACGNITGNTMARIYRDEAASLRGLKKNVEQVATKPSEEPKREYVARAENCTAIVNCDKGIITTESCTTKQPLIDCGSNSDGSKDYYECPDCGKHITIDYTEND